MQSKLSLLLRPKVLEDLEEIYSHTFNEWGVEQAERYQDDLYNAMSNLVMYPELGRVYDVETGSHRTLPVRKHLIFYKKVKNKIIVTRILHMNVDKNRHSL